MTDYHCIGGPLDGEVKTIEDKPSEVLTFPNDVVDSQAHDPSTCLIYNFVRQPDGSRVLVWEHAHWIAP